MIFRVYNQNGKVKITKVCRDNVERPMFSNVPDGEFVEIETEVTQCSRSMKKKIGQAEETQTESSDKAVRVLEFAISSGIDYEDEAKLAVSVLDGAADEACTAEARSLVRNRELLGAQIRHTLFGNVISCLEFACANGIISDDEKAHAVSRLAEYAGSVV